EERRGRRACAGPQPRWSGATWALAGSGPSSFAPTVGRGQVELAVQLERSPLWVLGEDQRGDAPHVGGREAVARGADPCSADPGNLHVDATSEELDGRRGVVEEGQ